MAAGIVSAKHVIANTNTPEKLTAASQIISGLSVKNGDENAGGTIVRVGPAGVNGNSYPLIVSESLEFDYIDTATVYLYGPAGAVVYYFGLIP